MYDYTVDEQTLPSGIKVKVKVDENPMSPREWDNVSHMLCWHTRYNLGDEQWSHNGSVDLDAVVDYIRDKYEPTIIRGLYLYDHSGLSISMSQSPFDPGGWDTSFVGLIFDTAEGRDLLGTPTDNMEEIIEAELDTYDKYLRGDVYGYVVEDADGLFVDSCWGFYSDADALAEGLAIARHEQARKDVIEVEGLATYAYNPDRAGVSA